jgi:ABC-type Fe3+/spermidine/putrescine transport system ATPase subunit
MSDRFGLMNSGQIEQREGSCRRATYPHPASRFVADVVGVADFLSAIVLSGTPRRLIAEIGRPAVPRDGHVASDQPVELSGRPEKLSLIRTDSGAAEPVNRLPGRIEGVAHLGATTHYAAQSVAGRR